MRPEIPIQNIYYLLCYAWNKLEEGKIVDVSSLDSTSLVDLFAKVLHGGTLHLIRRGFDRGYLPCTEERITIRGKIHFPVSVRRQLFRQGRAVCEFDELDHDVLHNRILKTTIQRLIAVPDLNPELKEGLADLLRRLGGVSPIFLSSQIFRRVQLHRNNQYYGFLMNICELIHENLLADEQRGQSRFRDFLREEAAMRRLFEAFVKNFYRIERSAWYVPPPIIEWNASFADPAVKEYLPQMRTDVCLKRDGRLIIIDCKFYREALQHHYGKPTLKSPHLYQLYAYLKNLERVPEGQQCKGILLYPAVNYSLDLSFELDDHPIRIRTLNLNQEWRRIEEDLLQLI